MSIAELQSPFRAFFESCTEILGVLDREGRVVRANRAFREALGEGDACLLDRVPEPHRALLTRGLAGDEVRAWTGPVRTAEGELERFCFTWGVDEQGARHVVGRRLRDPDPVSDEDRRARALIRHADLAIVGVSWTGEIVSWNPAAQAMFGYTAEEAIGQPGAELLDAPEDRPDLAVIGETLASEGVAKRVGLNRARDGRRLVCSWQIVLLRDDEGAPLGVSSLVQDITEQARLERALREHIALLTQQQATIQALSTPILTVWDGVLALPVIGHVDAERAERLMDALLEEIARTGARHAIVDVTGVEALDTATVHYLERLLSAIRLLGAEGILTGVRPAVAQSLVALGAELPDVPMLRNLQAGLQRCLRAVARGRAG